MLIFFDGDNIRGAKDYEFLELTKNDTVYLYYATNNNYYLKNENRDNLTKKCRCKIEWKKIDSTNNAVDFAIAIDLMDHLCSESHYNIYCIISNDKHFNTIEKYINKKEIRGIVSHETSVKEAILKYKILESNDLMEFHNLIIKMYGDYFGNKIYEMLKRYFRQQFHNVGSFKRRERIGNLISIFKRGGEKDERTEILQC